MSLARLQRGDTIIEVMVAFSVFAMVAVGALAVMNQGTAGAQNTLETTLVRQQIDNQAELLRYMHQAYLANPNDATDGLSAKFRGVVTFAKAANLTQPSKYGDDCTQTIPGSSSTRFALDPATGNMVATVGAANDEAAPPYAQLTSGPSGAASYGIWVEPVISNAIVADGTTQYIDFHVRACWNSASSSAPQRTLGTIVRTYVPENVVTGTTGGGGSTIPLPPPHEFTLTGASANPCYPHKDLERGDAEGNPGWAPFATFPNPDTRGVNTTGTPDDYDCKYDGGAVSNCANFDSQFTPNIPTESAGNYDLIISYHDAFCGGAAIPASYNYKIGVYKNNTLVGDYDLSAASNSHTIDIGAVTATTTIQIRWWNNHFIVHPQDPDLAIDQIILKRKNP